jgi:hypothetical protein
MTDFDLPPHVESCRPVADAAGEVLGDGPGRSTLALQRAAFLKAAVLPDTRGIPRWTWLSLPAALGLACAVVLLLRRPAALATYDGRELGEHELVRSRAGVREPLSLSDGSALKLSTDTQLELTELSGSRARLTLRHGSVAANVQKVPGRVFSIFAGAYEVRVVGTTFDVDYRGDELAVGVSEGKVLVRGGKLPGSGTLLGPGQRFDTRRLASAAPPEEKLSPEESVASSARPTVVAPSASAPKPSWSELSRDGRYREALLLAEQLGFERLTRTLGDEELLLLANTARFAGDSTRAKLAFGAIRTRFAGRPVAKLSALYLARVAESHDHDPAAAVRWLRVFLAEAPNSDMAPGARASLIDIALKRGNQAEARSAAADYLTHHPRGPHASQAQAVLGRGK